MGLFANVPEVDRGRVSLQEHITAPYSRVEKLRSFDARSFSVRAAGVAGKMDAIGTFGAAGALGAAGTVGAWVLCVYVLCALALAPAGAQAADASTNAVRSGQGIEIDQRAESILEQMTLAEKIRMIAGGGLFETNSIPRLNVPAMTAADGPFGVRNFVRTNVYAGGIALAATWNTDLAQHLGTELGRDARSRGVHFYLAPGVNIYRSPLNGRNFEYLGEDPYLAGRTASAFITGVQSQGVAATVKHFIGNNSEFARHTSDALIDERTAREIYLPAFEAAVKSGQVAAVMDSYNLVNGEHMTQNRRINVALLKEEWGFKGVLM